MHCRTFSLKQKLEVIEDIKFSLDLGESLANQVCWHGINKKTMECWLQNKMRYQNAKKKYSSKARQVHPGKESLLAPISDELVRFIYECQEQGIAVTIPMVCRQGHKLYIPSCRKSKKGTRLYHLTVC